MRIHRERIVASIFLLAIAAAVAGGDAFAQQPAAQQAGAQEPAAQEPTAEQPLREFLLLATSKTSTLEEELNEAADAGYRFLEVMGGETAFGGDEAVAIMERVDGGEPQRYEYKLLATSRTSTMQEEAQEAADAGFQYKGQTVFSSLFGGDEVVLILERDVEFPPQPYEVLLLATSKTSTMQEELSEAADAGYEFVGFTVGSTAFRGNEVVAIMRRRIER
jgi:hypothetical protein